MRIVAFACVESLPQKHLWQRSGEDAHFHKFLTFKCRRQHAPNIISLG